jgi:Trk K+ transport system NAD-binding subunit
MGNVGYRVVQLLRRLGEPVTVVSGPTRDEWLRVAAEDGVRILRGDARDEALLAQAGLAEARAVIAATDDDAANIEIALDSRRSRPGLPVVVRLFDQHLARHLSAGLDVKALGVASLAAPAFAAAALGEQWISSFSLDGERYVIGRLSLPEAVAGARALAEVHGLFAVSVDDAPAAGPEAAFRTGARLTVAARRRDWERFAGRSAPAGESRWRVAARNVAAVLSGGVLRKAWNNAPTSVRSLFLLFNLLILMSVFVFQEALHLSLVDALYFIVTTVTTVGYGDITPREAGTAVKLYACGLMLLGSATVAVLYSILTDFIVTARFQQLLGRQRIPEQGHVIVAGLGNVGFRITQELREIGVTVVGVERDPEGEFLQAVRSTMAVVVGDARLSHTLVHAGAAKAHAVIAAIDDDIVDLGIVLAARRVNPKARLVARVFSADFARKVQDALHVDAALSTSLLAAPAFVASALDAGALAAFVQAGRLYTILEREAPAEWATRKPAALREESGVIVLMRRLAGGAYGPAHEEPLAAGEEIVVAVAHELRA